MIKEELLYYIWRTKNFNHNHLTTTRGENINIISYGQLNSSDGPDFLEAQVEIGDVLWSGAIEIHTNSSDWKKHMHEKDTNYKKVILHVVFNHDAEIKHSIDEHIPCLELKKRIPHNLIEIYKAFDRKKWIPCEHLINSATVLAIASAKEKNLANRFDRRLQEVESMNKKTEKDWEELCYRLLLRAFGLVHNAEAFLSISNNVPLQIVKKNRDSNQTLEALFYGASGLLDREFSDDYPRKLKEDFSFLYKKYRLNRKAQIALRHKAIRPQNFPTIKLSQFANMIMKPGIVSKLIHSDISQIEKLLTVSASPYWHNHYTFDKLSKSRKKTLGKSRIRVIILNAIVPTLYFIGKKYGDEEKLKRAKHILEKLPSENNVIIKRWKSLGISCENAYDSQALLELKKYSCDIQACLNCPIGHHILKNA